ncbi:SDR family NAD(P)-dependent oxidoreductase [Mycobacterium basiliense]
MTAHLNHIDQTRAARNAITPLTTQHGLALFDAALTHHQPTLIPAPLNPRTLNRLAHRNALPPILSALTTTRPHAATTTSPTTLSTQLATQTPDQQRHTLTTLVTTTTATVLAHPDPTTLDPDRPFKDLGIDSLTALELRNTLAQHTGQTLPPTLIFDHPTPTTLAHHLTTLLTHHNNTTTPTGPHRPTATTNTDEPIAVVGMACRFPGGVDSAAALWELVSSGTDVMGPFPNDRGWDLTQLFDSDPDAVGKTYARYGGFLAQAGHFDAEFFGISAREAQAIDPQQRLLLEVCWEALETAGIDPATLAGSQTGVFAGTWAQSYGDGNSHSAEGYAMTGSATSVASGRVAYLLGLQGPAITVDTACSSSLVATHLACQSLRNAESSLALAGGVTIMTTPGPFTEFARQRALAPDGRCKAFAAAADGTGWGEGAAVLVLERLSDAHRHHHRVLAVIAGSAINQDGASNGLTAPNGLAQQRVITQAAANAAIDLDHVDVVEAHGTGTTLGDPIEATALIATYGSAPHRTHPLWLGSIKSNLGHTQAAAGAAGLIKMICALNHDTLPPTLHVDHPSPHVDWSAGTVQLLTQPTPWPDTDHPRTAAVSSFGISGTNAHVILQTPTTPAPTTPTPTTTPACDPPPRIWPLSARTPTALHAQAARLHHHLLDHPNLDLTDLAHSLATTRTHHPYRAALTTPTTSNNPREDLLEALHALTTNHPHPGLASHHLTHTKKIVFVLPGQGAQYPAMAAQLYEHHRIFAETLNECDHALHPWTGWSVRDVLTQHPSAPPLHRVDVIQPVLFAIMISLAELLRTYGIIPDAVIGHSQGEIAAAHIAGALPLDQAAKIVALRSQALTALSGHGAMASVRLSPHELHPHLQPWNNTLTIAAANGPTHTIISGDPTALEQFTATCQHHGIHIRPIAVDYASHSPQVEQLHQHLLHQLGELTPQPAQIPLYTTVQSAQTDDPLDTTTMNADYWYRNLREPVEFHNTITTLLAQGPHTFIELSPHPVLAPALTDTITTTDQTQSTVITTLHRDRPHLDTLTTALAQLHTHGHSPHWPTLYPHAHTLELPTYPFQHHHYWLTPTTTTDITAAGLDHPDHPLLGAITDLADQDQIILSARLSTHTQPWLASHRVHDTIIFPAAGLIELLLHAGQHTHYPTIDELILHSPLTLPEHTPTDLQITIHPPDDTNRRPLTVHTRTTTNDHHNPWHLHATATLSTHQPPTPTNHTPPPLQPINPDDFYHQLATHGLHYQPPFQNVHALHHPPTNPDTIYAHIALPPDTTTTGYGIHPALLDAALHPLTTLTHTHPDTDPDTTPLPFALTGITLHATTATQLHTQLTRTNTNTYTLHATDPTGAPVITITTLTLRDLPHTPQQPTPTPHHSLFHLDWPALPPTTPNTPETPNTNWALITPDTTNNPHLPPTLNHLPTHPDLTHPDLTHHDLLIWPLPQPHPNTTDLQHLHTLTQHTLTQLQHWLTRPDTTHTHLAILTHHAITTSPHDPHPNLAHAATWALIHTTQNEHPHRITLIDTDHTPTTNTTLPTLLTTLKHTTEPQLALRHGTTHTPRLTPTPQTTPAPETTPTWDPQGTVLITGGTGMLGALFAEHLITHYGTRHLLLVSRRGPTAPGATELHQHLTNLGAHVTITACDTTNPHHLATLLDTIPTEHPLTAIIHTAGILDDAVLTELTDTQLHSVLAAKADTAWHLHQLTTNHNLAAFIMFSSIAATLGSPGQANYAAANAALDAIAHHHPNATSLAWGYWETPSAMTAHLNHIDQTRAARNAITPLTTQHGLALFDAALTHHQPTLIPAPLNPRTLNRLAHRNALPPILSALTTTRPHAATTTSPTTLSTQLATQTPDQQRHTLTTLVTTTTATVLAHPDPTTLDPDRPFKDLGIDSLTALELRNTLAQHTGQTLPPTLIFDHPTPTTLAHHLTTLLTHHNNTTTPTGPHRPTATTNTDEPIAVVGMACRFPGGVDSAAALWELVSSGTDVMGPFPNDRGWDLTQLFDSDPDAVGKTYARYGGFLAQAGHFDAEFFGISAREAQAIDPQQRLLLEVCWEALETAGIDPATLAGSQTGVFAGTWAQSYGDGNSHSAEGYAMTGSATSVASGRVAYLLGLQGPAITVDTACSSSLVATHLACQSLRNAESSLALAGGVTIMTTPGPFTEFARQRALAPDGRCKAFAAAADGTGWGEGAAVLVLERLSDAHRHHHRVLAVIAGSAINQDGASNGLTAPNGLAQQRVITQAAANAAIDLDHVDVVEAHGTGTTLGDPIEATALIATYGSAPHRTHPLWLGSIKSNLGHTQAAAGAAGLIKMICALNHDTLPPTLHVDHPSPHVDWSAGTVQLLTQPTPWPDTDHPRTAAVSSFGISGTNAHVILQTPTTPAPTTPTPTTTPACDPPPRIWPLSARTPTALHAQAARLHHHLLDHPNLDLTDLAHSLATTRTHHPYRAALTTPTTSNNPREDLLEALHALTTNHPHPGLASHHLTHTKKIVFVLPGQGAQYPAMAAQLYEHHRIFAETLDHICAAFDPHLDTPLHDVLTAPADTHPAQLLGQTAYAQPALFAYGAAMHAVLTHAGITPDYLLGHSLGELTAAYLAEVLSLPQAATLVAARGRLMQTCTPGAMLAIHTNPEHLTDQLHHYPHTTIAAINSPTSIVIAGPHDDINALHQWCTTEHYQTTQLPVSHAFHSPTMDPALPEFHAIATTLTWHPPTVPILSNLTGQLATPDQLTSAHYWTQHLRQPVRFADNLTTLLAQGPHTFLELSPHPVLAPAITDTLTHHTNTASTVITTTHRDRPHLDTLTTALAQLHTHGHSPHWPTLYPHAHTLELPTYPFQHHHYWLTPTTTTDITAAGLDHPDHPLLGAITDLADQDQIILSARLSTHTQPWLASHRVHDTIIFPAAGLIELLLHAGQHTHYPTIDELILHSPLTLPEHTPTDLQITIHPPDDTNRRPLTVHTRTTTNDHHNPWHLHATATLSTHQPPTPTNHTPPPLQPINPDDFYHQLATHGLHYQPPFQNVHALHHPPTNPDTIYAHIALPPDTTTTGYGIHPALLDAALHPLTTLTHTHPDTDPDTTPLPFALTGITLHATTATQLHTQLTRTNTNTYTLHATDPTGAPVITITTLTLRDLPHTPQQPTPTPHHSLFHLDWPALPPTTPNTPETPNTNWALITPDTTNNPHLPPPSTTYPPTPTSPTPTSPTTTSSSGPSPNPTPTPPTSNTSTP